VWIAKNSPGGTDTIDCKGGYPAGNATEFFGLDPTSPVEASSVNTGTASSTFAGTPITLSDTGVLWSSLRFNCNGQVTIMPAGMTLLDSYNNNRTLGTAYVAEAPGTYGVTWNTAAFNGCGAEVFEIGLKGNPTSVQTADLQQNKLSNGTLVSGVNGAALPYTVPVMFSALPGCSTAAGIAGSEATVKDSSVSAWGSTVAGTGTAVTPYTHVWCDGAHWVVR
jgi:hypothetical protein